MMTLMMTFFGVILCGVATLMLLAFGACACYVVFFMFKEIKYSWNK